MSYSQRWAPASFRIVTTISHSGIEVGGHEYGFYYGSTKEKEEKWLYICSGWKVIKRLTLHPSKFNLQGSSCCRHLLKGDIQIAWDTQGNHLGSRHKVYQKILEILILRFGDAVKLKYCLPLVVRWSEKTSKPYFRGHAKDVCHKQPHQVGILPAYSIVCI